MRVGSRRLSAGFVCAGLAAIALAPQTSAAAAAPPASTSPQPPSAAVVPDAPPAATPPAPPAAAVTAPVDPQAPLVLTEPEEHHAVEDPAETAKPLKPSPKPKATAPKAGAKPADAATPEPGVAAPPPPAADAALAAIPAVPRAGVPGYFIDSFRIPVFLLPILQAAGTEYGVRWEILAAINEIETDYGRNLNVSTAGATGWMQFMPATWSAYGVDANRDGSADPYNPVDAIFSAARYLQAAGAQTDLRAAIFAYNHAGWYVASVLERAQRLAALPADLVGALTGLASGRSPVLGQARAVKSAVTHSRSLKLRVRDGARVVAVADARVVGTGRTARLGRYVRLRDVFGNTYTYGGLSRLERRFPVLRPAPRQSAAPTPAKVEQDPAHRAPATAGRQPAAAAASPAPAPAAPTQPTASSAPAAPTQPAAAPSAAATPAQVAGAPAAPALPALSAAAQREWAAAVTKALAPLVADPTRGYPTAAQLREPVARLAGPLAALDWGARALRLGIGAPAAAPTRPKRTVPAPPTRYDRRLLGDVPASRVTYRPLRVGSRVVAGTILGRAERPSGRPARVRFEIAPAGRRSARIDPAPIVAGWKLLQDASADKASLGVSAQPSVGQVMLLGKQALERLVLANPRIAIYPCGRDDIRAGRIDRRVLATLQMLAMSGLSPTVSSLQCGHSRLTASGNVSEHWSGNAVDIAAINGTPILGNQGGGSITDLTIRKLLTLQGTMQPHQIISLMTYAEAANTMALADHADHIHVGFSPQTAARLPCGPSVRRHARAKGVAAPRRPPRRDRQPTRRNRAVGRVDPRRPAAAAAASVTDMRRGETDPLVEG